MARWWLCTVNDFSIELWPFALKFTLVTASISMTDLSTNFNSNGRARFGFAYFCQLHLLRSARLLRYWTQTITDTTWIFNCFLIFFFFFSGFSPSLLLTRWSVELELGHCKPYIIQRHIQIAWIGVWWHQKWMYNWFWCALLIRIYTTWERHSAFPEWPPKRLCLQSSISIFVALASYCSRGLSSVDVETKQTGNSEGQTNRHWFIGMLSYACMLKLIK